MSIKNETVCAVSESISFYKPIVSYLPHNARPFEQKNVSKVSSAGSLDAPRDPYLTYTDKSSLQGENKAYFQEKSQKLWVDTIELNKHDKKLLQQKHTLHFQRLKRINDHTIVLYQPSNMAGNAICGYQLAQNMSDTDKARYASKQLAMEKALANYDTWAYFATFTFDPKKQPRYNFKLCQQRLSSFFHTRGVAYFYVMEQHKDGAWHAHALLSKEIGPYLSEFSEGDNARKAPFIAKCISEGKPVFDCKAYRASFGFCTITPCRNREACCHYMTKYVLKTFDDPNYERVSRRRFFCSKGLKNPEIILPNQVDLEEYFPVNFCCYTYKVTLRKQDLFFFKGNGPAGPPD